MINFDLFFNKLSAYYRTPLYQRETLIIFDEVGTAFVRDDINVQRNRRVGE